MKMTANLSRRDLKAQQDRRGFMILGGCAAVLGVAGLSAILKQPPARDATTGCLRTGVAHHLATVVDRTDPWRPADRELLRRAITKLADGLPVEGRLTLLPFSGGADVVPVLAFDRCRPVEGKDVNPAFSTPGRADQAYAASYGTPLSAQIDALTREVANAPSTNLVQFIATTAATLGYSSTASRKVLRVYSDMAEHTPSGSFIGRQPFTPASFTAYFNERIGDRLKGIELHIVVTPSASTPPAVARRIKEGWTAALSSKGINFTWERL